MIEDIHTKGAKHQKRGDRAYYQYSLRDFFKLYKRRKFKKSVEKKTYQNFLLDFFAVVFKAIVNERWTFYLPNRLGHLLISSRVSNLKSLPIDLTHKSKNTRHLNQHSHMRVYGMKWIKKHVRFNNSKYYKFETWKSKSAFDKYGSGSRAIAKMVRETSEDPSKKLIP